MREKKEINIQIGERIKAAREQSKFTQEALAERIGVSTQYISDLERGVVGISVPTLRRLCISLNISSDQILFGNNSDSPVYHFSDKLKTLNSQQISLIYSILSKVIEAIELDRHSDTPHAHYNNCK